MQVGSWRIGPRPAGLRRASFASLGFVGLVALGACYSPTPPPGLPCSDDLQCPDGQVCSANSVCITSGSVRSMHDDDENDFEHDDAILQDAIITRRGYVEAAPWMTHGLRVAAIPRATFDDGTLPMWDELAAEPRSGQSHVYSASIAWSDTGTPPGLGFTKGSDVSLLMEGEIYLEVGTWKLELRADDAGFLDVADPGTTAFRRVLVAKFDAFAAGNLEVKVAGWYPVRMAMSNKSLAGNLSLRGTVGAGVPGVFDSTRLRAGVPADATGLIADAFDSPSLMHFRSSSVAGEIRALTYDAAPPPDSGIATATAYSMRWAGQFYVESRLEGFTLATTGGGHRIWIDGELRADKLSSNAATSVLTGLELTAGWHDVVLDLDKRVTGNTTLRITDLQGDQEAFDRENLRPVIAPAQRWLSSRNTTTVDTLLPEPPMVLTRNLFLPNIAGTINAINLEYTVEHTALAELSLSARSGATTRLIAAAGSLTGADFTRLRFSPAVREFPGTNPGTSWIFTVADTVALMGTGDLREVAVSIGYTATGAASLPLAQVATYVSDPRELDDVVAFGKASWKLRDATGVTVTASLRTCARKEECATAEWVPIDAEGRSAAVPSTYVQYRVIMESSGTIAAALDSFTLEYYTDE